jgi:2,6-dihydroxypyridine 3-monooxygenase
VSASPRIAVVGGSLAGLTAGALLHDAGYNVDIYERSAVPLSGFGTGIVVQPEIVRYFIERTDITLDQISLPSQAMRYFNAGTGELIGEIAANWRYTSYNALYRGLLRSYGTERYHLGQTLVGIEQRGDEVELRFASGLVTRCDLAIAADGSFSTMRQRVFGIAPEYSGYISWRGTASRSVLSQETWEFFDNRFTYGLLDSGHTISYPIPVASDEFQIVKKQINFQWYWNVPPGPELDEFMTDRDGIRRPVSVHAEGVQPRFVSELHRRARDWIAVEPIVELLRNAEKPFVTVIADASVPQMRVGRVCFIGDAAIASRPHAAAGAAKAAANAWALAEALSESDGDIDEALHRWEPLQLEAGYAFLAKVRYMASLLQHGGDFRPGDPRCSFGLPAVVDGIQASVT